MEKRKLNWLGGDTFAFANVLELYGTCTVYLSVGRTGPNAERQGWIILYTHGSSSHYAPPLYEGDFEFAKSYAEDWLFAGLSFCPPPRPEKKA